MNDDNDNFLWYAAGLHFECLKCGRCCSGPAEGYIWVSRPEIKLIARHLNMPAGEVRQKYLRRVGFRVTIIEDVLTRDCVFLRDNEGRKECMIYPVRPSQCRNWPFWPANLVNLENWNHATRKCPGINRGVVYSPQRIQAIKNNAKWWRVEKT